MHPDLEKLIVLQQADHEIARLREEISALPKRVAAIEAQLAGTRSKIEKTQAGHADLQLMRRKLEHEIQAQQEKISKYREQSLAVKTNDQYRALQHEIEFAEKEIRACEDKILEGMMEADAREAERRALETELQEETAEVEQEQAAARKRTEEDEAQLSDWNGQRTTLRAGITGDVLDLYDRLLIQRRNSAIAEAIEHQCSACHVLLRPQTYAEVRGNAQIVTCDSCGRILYYDPAHEPEAPPARRKSRRAAAAENDSAGHEDAVAETGASAAESV